MTAEDKKWQAESDMRTLAEAEAIKSDRQRLSKAKKAGAAMVKEKKQEVKRLQKVAKNPSRKPTAKKSPGKKKRK